VNVTGAALQCGENRGIDQADDRAGVALRGQLVDRDAFVATGLILADNVEREALAGILQHALRLFSLLEDLADLALCGNFGDDALAQQQADFVDHHQLAGIGDGDDQPAIVGLFERNEEIAEHQVGRDVLEQLMVQLEIVQVDELAAIAPGDILRLLEVSVLGGGGYGLAVPPRACVNRFVFLRRCHFSTNLHTGYDFPLMDAGTDGEDGQIQRDQYAAHENCHDDQDNRFN
jgi:hypothetical protein